MAAAFQLSEVLKFILPCIKFRSISISSDTSDSSILLHSQPLVVCVCDGAHVSGLE